MFRYIYNTLFKWTTGLRGSIVERFLSIEIKLSDELSCKGDSNDDLASLLWICNLYMLSVRANKKSTYTS